MRVGAGLARDFIVTGESEYNNIHHQNGPKTNLSTQYGDTIQHPTMDSQPHQTALDHRGEGRLTDTDWNLMGRHLPVT